MPPTRPGQDLLRRLATSQRIVERAARSIAGHEMDACPLDHPLVGRLRCGEWLLFSGVHDLMHLEQLEDLEASLRMSVRPDLVECWVFRVVPPSGPSDVRPDAERLEVLLIRRAPHRIFPGLWQCVTGGVEPGERVPAAALREVEEETGLGRGRHRGLLRPGPGRPVLRRGLGRRRRQRHLRRAGPPGRGRHARPTSTTGSAGCRRPRRRASRSGRPTRSPCDECGPAPGP